MIENILKMAKDAVNAEWLSKVKELKEIAIKSRSAPAFEKLERLDLRKLAGTKDDPAIVQVTAINNRRSVKTEKMDKPMNVFDAEVKLSSDANVKLGKYAIWENTTVLTNEMENYAKNFGNDGDITGKTFNIAYFGTIPSKKNKRIEIHIFKVLPQED